MQTCKIIGSLNCLGLDQEFSIRNRLVPKGATEHLPAGHEKPF